MSETQTDAAVHLTTLLATPTRAAGIAQLAGADWGDLLAVTVSLGGLADTQELAEAVTAVQRLVRLGRRGAGFEEYGPDTAEAAVTNGLRGSAGRPDVYLALLPILDAVRARG